MRDTGGGGEGVRVGAAWAGGTASQQLRPPHNIRQRAGRGTPSTALVCSRPGSCLAAGRARARRGGRHRLSRSAPARAEGALGGAAAAGSGVTPQRPRPGSTGRGVAWVPGAPLAVAVKGAETGCSPGQRGLVTLSSAGPLRAGAPGVVHPPAAPCSSRRPPATWDGASHSGGGCPSPLSECFPHNPALASGGEGRHPCLRRRWLARKTHEGPFLVCASRAVPCGAQRGGFNDHECCQYSRVLLTAPGGVAAGAQQDATQCGTKKASLVPPFSTQNPCNRAKLTKIQVASSSRPHPPSGHPCPVVSPAHPHLCLPPSTPTPPTPLCRPLPPLPQQRAHFFFPELVTLNLKRMMSPSCTV